MSTADQPSLRLQKFIADCGLTSRRKAEEYILQGRVKVNGKLVTTLGTKVDPAIDVVEVDQNFINLEQSEKIYIILNKPRGYVTTVHDPEGRKTVLDLCGNLRERIYPVGRLDYLSEGLLIMTNDGELANMIIHPRFEIEKVYEVKVFGVVSKGLLAKLRAGIQSEVGFLKPKSVRVVKLLPHKTWIEFRLAEGRNREIRRICEGHGLTIDKLRRVSIGGLSIDGLAPGSFHFLTKKELLLSIGLNADGTKKGENIAYHSPKKTVDFSRLGAHSSKGGRTTSLADDKEFYKYRKEHYQRTMQYHKQREQENLSSSPRNKNFRS